MYESVNVWCVCICVSEEGREGVRSPEGVVAGSCELPRGFRDLHLGSLPEQQVFTAEPQHQALILLSWLLQFSKACPLHFYI